MKEGVVQRRPGRQSKALEDKQGQTIVSSSSQVDESEHTTTMSSGGGEFDTLRREASRLERQLEDRIGKYQQLGQKITTTSNIASGGGRQSSSLLGRPSDLEGGGGGSNNIQVMFMEETKLSADIERMLQTFKEQIDRMATAAVRGQHHVFVKRCREITYDFQSDYQKMRQNMQRRKETFELFSAASSSENGSSSNGSIKRSTFGVESGNGDGGDMEHLLRERNHIANSTNAANSILGQAGETFNELKNQRKSLMGASGTLVSMAQTIPGVNRLIEQIRVKRNKDDLIVAGVIAGCILFTLWYLFS